MNTGVTFDQLGEDLSQLFPDEPHAGAGLEVNEGQDAAGVQG